jgi:hypothetical protein
MKVHLFYSSLPKEQIDLEVFENVVDFLQQSKGPIQFAAGMLDYRQEVPAFSMRSQFNSVEVNIHSMSLNKKLALPKQKGKIRTWFSAEKFQTQKGKIEEPEPEPSPDFPKREAYMPWDYFFDQCRRFREMNSLPDQDHVFLLSNMGNDKNWFGSIGPSGRDYFIHTANWDYFFKNADEQFPISYEVVVWLLRHLMFGDRETMLNGIHSKPKGCANDFCQNKEEIQLKMRTADVCQLCMDKLQVRSYNPLCLAQILDVFERVRAHLLFRERAALLNRPCRIEVVGFSRHLFFPDLGNTELKLNPKEKTLFLFFLNHPEGVRLTHLCDHKRELEQLYSRFVRSGDQGGVREAIERLVDRTDSNQHEVLSRIKSKIIGAVGSKMAPLYLISGDRDEPKKICLDREFVLYRD